MTHRHENRGGARRAGAANASDTVTPVERPVVLDTAYRAMYQLLGLVQSELECRNAPACRYDVIVSQTATQRGAPLKGPDGSQGRVWIREELESPTTITPCPQVMIDIEVGIVRCHTTVAPDEKSLPDEDTYAAETLLVYQDKQSVMAAASAMSPKPWLVGWRPYGPQGDAIGSITTLRVRRP